MVHISISRCAKQRIDQCPVNALVIAFIPSLDRVLDGVLEQRAILMLVKCSGSQRHIGEGLVQELPSTARFLFSPECDNLVDLASRVS